MEADGEEEHHLLLSAALQLLVPCKDNSSRPEDVPDAANRT